MPCTAPAFNLEQRRNPSCERLLSAVQVGRPTKSYDRELPLLAPTALARRAKHSRFVSTAGDSFFMGWSQLRQQYVRAEDVYRQHSLDSHPPSRPRRFTHSLVRRELLRGALLGYGLERFLESR